MLVKDKLKSSVNSLDPQEIERFNRLAEEWWKPDGVFKVIHGFNKKRFEYLRSSLCQLLKVRCEESYPLKGYRVLDAGCGAGLISEPMAALGADVIGIDPSEQNIKIATQHAHSYGIKVTYKHTLAEEMDPLKDGMFDVVLSLEVVEHVGNLSSYLNSVARLLKPGGYLIIGTLNRTIGSYIKAIVGAEYVLGLLPRGTHSWNKFITPEELLKNLEPLGYRMIQNCGISFNPITGNWSTTSDLSVNYMQIHQKMT